MKLHKDRENIERNLATPAVLSAEERAVLQRMREHAAKHRDEWLGWPTEKMYADEVVVLDRLLAVSALAPSALSAEELRGMQLMRLHLDEGGHDWREGTAMADVQATCLALDRLLGGKP